MKLKRHIVIPAALLVYLAAIAWWSYDGVERGELPIWQFVATILASLIVIIALFFVLHRREKLRRERIDDLNDKNEITNK